ncbi:MAG: type II toxin-antitoxin system HicB family antitoxin [bacterium]
MFGLQGVWANADSLEVCRDELREVLEEWLIIGLKLGQPIPVIDGIELNVNCKVGEK